MFRPLSSCLVTIALAAASLPAAVKAYEQPTHRRITERAAVISGLDALLKTQLGLSRGLRELLSEKEVIDLISDGVSDEDDPITRSANHFHNPLFPADRWDEAGLSSLFFNGQSSPLWAQNPAQDTSGRKGGNWSWRDARRFFYGGLTGRDLEDPGRMVADTKDKREALLANAFRALGHQVHFIQDASVPEHVRNNVHIDVVGTLLARRLGNYEQWLLNLQRDEDPALFASFLEATPVEPDPAVLKNPLPAGFIAPVPIARLIDNDQYDGRNPEVTAGPLARPVGIAEYTNANFFSKDRIPPDTTYPFPAIDPGKTDFREIPSPFPAGGTFTRLYYVKTEPGDKDYLLATEDRFDLYRRQLPPEAQPPKLPGRDFEVFKEYVRRLLPRAVGYSAGLLRYFFRGKFTLLVQPNGMVRLRNLTAEPADGYFAVYRLDAERNPTLLTEYPRLALGPRGDPGDTSGDLPFPADPAAQHRYLLVFRGSLGLEQATEAELAQGKGVAVAAALLRPRLAFARRNFAQVAGTTVLFRDLFVMDPDDATGASAVQLTKREPGELFDDGLPAWSPDGGRLAFTSTKGGARTLWVMDADGGNREELRDAQGNPVPAFSRPAWSPDGSRLVFPRDESSTPDLIGYPVLYRYDFRTRAVERMSPDPPEKFIWHSPAFTPDGSAIVVAASTDQGFLRGDCRDASLNLLVVDPADGRVRDFLTCGFISQVGTQTGGMYEARPTLALAAPPGASAIVVFEAVPVFTAPSPGTEQFDLYQVPLAGGAITPVTATTRIPGAPPVDEEDPALSPDGRRLAFLTDFFGDSDLVVTPFPLPDPANPYAPGAFLRLAPALGPKEGPAWSPVLP